MRTGAIAEKIRVAIIGTVARSGYIYGPIVKGLPEDTDVDLVAVWSHRAEPAGALGARLGVPWDTDLDRLTRETVPAIGIVSVASAANGVVGLMAVEHGLHALLETPIAHRLDEADAIIAAASQRGETFDACKYAMDTLKANAPIWKKEVFADSEVWVGLQN